MGLQKDKFDIKMIYATRVGGREWFLRDSVDEVYNDSRAGGDLADDLVDGGNNNDGFTVKDNSGVRLKCSPDGSIMDSKNTGLNQSTAKGRGYAFTTKDWDMRGLECTARIKCTDYDTQDSRFIIKGPTGSHTSNTDDCSGSSYMVRFFLAPSGSESGSYQWSKEQWHVHYVNRGSITKHGQGSIFNKWVVCKYILYIVKSSDGKTNYVRIEGWINVNNDGVTFVKMGSTTDSGGWGDAADDCDAERGDEIMDWDNAHIIFRWDGPKIIFKHLSVREIDPSKIAGTIGEPEPSPTSGTLSRTWTLKNNIIEFPIDACNLGQDTSTIKTFYDVDSSGSASNLHKERYRVGTVANGSSSFLIGKIPKKVEVRLSRTGTLPAGDVTVVLRKGSDDEVAVTYTLTKKDGIAATPPLSAPTVPTSSTLYTFENLTAAYAWQNGDRLNVEYYGNTVDVANELNVFRNTDNPIDGFYTCLVKFDAGGIPPTAYSSPDLTRDLAWKIYE